MSRMWPISSGIIIKTLNQEEESHGCTPNFQAPTTQQVLPSPPNYEVGIETLVNQIVKEKLEGSSCFYFRFIQKFEF